MGNKRERLDMTLGADLILIAKVKNGKTQHRFQELARKDRETIKRRKVGRKAAKGTPFTGKAVGRKPSIPIHYPTKAW